MLLRILIFAVLFVSVTPDYVSMAQSGKNKSAKSKKNQKQPVAPVITAPAATKPVVEIKPQDKPVLPTWDIQSQATLPLPAEVRFGILPNGLRYYIQHNQKPENRVEFRLAVNAGSNQEEDNQKGLAHFVEHMAFNGSKNFSKNELVDYLEGIGTKFGAHLNAYTSFDETVYMLQLPTDKKEILDKGLTVLEDWASGLSFDTNEIDKERGVVYSEWRSGLGASKRMMEKYLPVVYYKSRYAERLPIGDTAIINTAPKERFTSFYKTWYRPELMAVVIVGDIDVDAMEKEIKQRFSGLQNPANAPAKQEYILPEHQKTLVSICTDPEATYSRAMLIYKHDAVPVNTAQGYRRYLMHALFNGMLNNRLQELMQQPEPPFFAAYSAYERETRANDAFNLTAVAKSGQTITALKALLTENERLKRFGFTASELALEKKSIQTYYENALEEKDKTESASLVQEYVTHFLGQQPAPGIAMENYLMQQFLPTITLEEINGLIKQFITEKNAVIVLTAPEAEKKFLPWENDVLAIADSVKKMAVTPYQEKVLQSSLLEKAPAAMPVVSSAYNKDYNITTLQLKNGAKVLLKPTTFKNDEILLSAYSPGGTSLYSDEDYMSADYSNAIVIESGVSDFDKISLQKMMTGKTAVVYPVVGELEEGFEGSSSRKDFESMLQLMYLYFTQPRKSADDFKSLMAKEKSANEHVLENPSAFFSHKLSQLMYNKNIRRGLTTLDKLEKVDFERAYSIYRERFRDASDFTFVLVGNFQADSILPLLETYIGGLPSAGQKETWKDPGVAKKEGVVTSKNYMGKTQKSLVGIHFHGQKTWTPEDNFVFNAMIKILNIQLREALREDKGGVYGVSVGGNFAERPKQAYGITISFNAEPKQAEELVKVVYDNIDSLRQHLTTAEKLQKVKETFRREREADEKENDFWVNMIHYYDAYQKDIATLADYPKMIDALTAEKIKEAFRTYFDRKNYIEAILYPEK